MTNNLRIFSVSHFPLFALWHAKLVSVKSSVLWIVKRGGGGRGEMLISRVGEQWHVMQAKDVWHMVHIWGTYHERLDHTARSCRESLTAVYVAEQTNPLHYALQVKHACGPVYCCCVLSASEEQLHARPSLLPQQQAIMSTASFFLHGWEQLKQEFSRPLAWQCKTNLFFFYKISKRTWYFAGIK